MDKDEKPPNEVFWTWDIILLTGVNILFLVALCVGFFLLFAGFYPLIDAWLSKTFGL